MTAPAPGVLNAIADELEVFASWHTGPKYTRVMQLVDKLRSGTVTDVAAVTHTATPPAPAPDVTGPGDKTGAKPA